MYDKVYSQIFISIIRGINVASGPESKLILCSKYLPKMLSGNSHLLCSSVLTLYFHYVPRLAQFPWKILINDECSIRVFYYKVTVLLEESINLRSYVMYLSSLLQFEVSTYCSIREY